MNLLDAYQTSHIKRARATKSAMQDRRDELASIVAGIAPCAVRQVFYQATVHGIVEKTEAGIYYLRLVARNAEGRYRSRPVQIELFVQV